MTKSRDSRAPWLWTALCLGLLMSAASAADRPNVLFIAIDDLRPELGCYGRAEIHSPNIDALAARSVLFERAYCMVPTCGASRASLMTGLRPRRDRFVSFLTRVSQDAPGTQTLNRHFKAAGYETISLGKIYHHPDDTADGWSQPAWRPKRPTYALERHLRQARENPGRRKNGPAVESADVPDSFYGDGKVANKAVEELQRLARGDKPFFLAVGFFKPHLPFVAPTRYWDHYPLDQVQMPSNYFEPKDVPPMALPSWGELRNYAGMPKQGILSPPQARELIRGYRAATSYADAQVGRVLEELEALQLADDTIVVLWGDHGWNLGEHTVWCKHCCFETSMRSVLLVKAPGLAPGRTSSLTEYVDIYPTLCDLAGLDRPEHLQGSSFLATLQDPEHAHDRYAIGRFRDGDTIRDDRYRLSIYRDGKGEEVGRMLYDHQLDPDENVNVAGQADIAEVEERLSRRLAAVLAEL